VNRRDFFKLAAGGTVALVATEYLAPVTNLLRPGRTWDWIKLYDFKALQNSPNYAGHIMGRRSDGKHFYCATAIRKDEFTPEVIDATIKNLHASLETFRDCECGEVTKCELHFQMFGAAWSEDDIEEDDAPVPEARL